MINGFPVTYYEHFTFSMDVEVLWDQIPWLKVPDAPRVECWCNDFGMSYQYGRGAGIRTYFPLYKWEKFAEALRNDINFKYGIYFEACFINGYENQKDHLGWHSDDSVDINHDKPIAIVSFGVEREIWFRKFPTNNTEILKLKLGSGSLCFMEPRSQFVMQHRIPKASFEAGKRISFTFRSLIKK
jgi:hypothetical protein